MSKSHSSLVIMALCVACGSKFEAGAGSGGAVGQAGANASAGHTSSAGADNGGAAGAPDPGTGGTIESGGAGGAGASAGSTAGGAGGAAAGTGGIGGLGGSGGSGGANGCASLKEQYRLALEKARVCDSGSTNQCNPSSTLPAVGCGCPTLVNAKSAATTVAKEKYMAYQDANCDIGMVCNIACIAYSSASCTSQMVASGTAFVCTGSNSGIAN